MQFLGIIHEVASNIDTYGTFSMITDLSSLRQWLYATTKRKLYIFDEANIHLSSRRAMSSKNVEIIRLFGEVSKAHARMIFIAQNLMRIDKELLDETWVRGAFIKKNLKKAQLVSHLLSHAYFFNNIPKCSTAFDPYAVAPFEEPTGERHFKEDYLNMLQRYYKGETWTSLGYKHPQEFNRELRKAIGYLLDKITV